MRWSWSVDEDVPGLPPALGIPDGAFAEFYGTNMREPFASEHEPMIITADYLYQTSLMSSAIRYRELQTPQGSIVVAIGIWNDHRVSWRNTPTNLYLDLGELYAHVVATDEATIADVRTGLAAVIEKAAEELQEAIKQRDAERDARS